MINNKCEYIYENLEKLFPNACCQLNYNTPFQLAVAVTLSAQTTDEAVNKVTRVLFEKYPDAYSLANGDINDIMDIIHSIGLYKNKAKYIKDMANTVVKSFNGVLPYDKNHLISLAGIGNKSANVIRSVAFNYPEIAVDTHVSRVTKRLALVNADDSVDQIEKKLQILFPKEKWSRLHHLLIFFGRYKCLARNPLCSDCPFKEFCCHNKK